MKTDEFIRNGKSQEEYKKIATGLILKKLRIARMISRRADNDIPKFIVFAGAPCSGKSTFIQSKKDKSKYFIVSQDDIKNDMMKLLGVPVDNWEWRELFQPHAWEITKDVLQLVMTCKVNIIYDFTLGNPKKLEDLIMFADNKGICYEYHLEVVYAPLETLKERNKLRAGHRVPENGIEAIFSKVPINILKVFRRFNSILCWDNTTPLSPDTPNYSSIIFDRIFFMAGMEHETNTILIMIEEIDQLKRYFGEYFDEYMQLLLSFNIVFDEE